MHEQRQLLVRNPGRPTMERLACRLTRDEKLARMDRTDAIERTIEQHEAEIASVKAHAKVEIDRLQETLTELQSERRKVRNERLDGYEERLVECELLEDPSGGMIYVYRLDTMQVAQRRDMAPHEQQELKLEGRVTRTVDVPDDVDEVVRFDSDPPSVTEPEPTNGKAAHYGHEHEYNEGACLTCGVADPDGKAPVEATKPKRRKKGDAAASAAH